MSDERQIHVPTAAEQVRVQAAREKLHAAIRAERSLRHHNPLRDPRTPAEALRAKFAGMDGGPPPRPHKPAPATTPNGPRVERDGAAERPPEVEAPKRRPNEYESEMLNLYRRSGRPVELVMRSGDRVVGELLRFDQYSLIVEINGVATVVFKHAVDLVRPAKEDS